MLLNSTQSYGFIYFSIFSILNFILPSTVKTQAHCGNQICPGREVEVMVLILQVTGMISVPP